MDLTLLTTYRDWLTGKLAISPAMLQGRRDYLIGICLLLVVVFLWTSSNFLTQVRTFSNSVVDD